MNEKCAIQNIVQYQYYSSLTIVPELCNTAFIGLHKMHLSRKITNSKLVQFLFSSLVIVALVCGKKNTWAY